jgi:hypothetical protein
VRGVSFSRRRQCSSRPRRCHAHVLTRVCVRCISRRCNPTSSPRAQAHLRRSGVLSILFVRPFAVLSRDRGVRRPQLPSSGSRIVGSLSSYYWVIQVDAHAPFDKGWFVVQKHVHESIYAGMLGRARSRSLGTEGTKALPRWDPSNSCPRRLLNTTCGELSSWWARG